MKEFGKEIATTYKAGTIEMVKSMIKRELSQGGL